MLVGSKTALRWVCEGLVCWEEEGCRVHNFEERGEEQCLKNRTSD